MLVRPEAELGRALWPATRAHLQLPFFELIGLRSLGSWSSKCNPHDHTLSRAADWTNPGNFFDQASSGHQPLIQPNRHSLKAISKGQPFIILLWGQICCPYPVLTRTEDSCTETGMVAQHGWTQVYEIHHQDQCSQTSRQGFCECHLHPENVEPERSLRFDYIPTALAHSKQKLSREETLEDLRASKAPSQLQNDFLSPQGNRQGWQRQWSLFISKVCLTCFRSFTERQRRSLRGETWPLPTPALEWLACVGLSLHTKWKERHLFETYKRQMLQAHGVNKSQFCLKKSKQTKEQITTLLSWKSCLIFLWL